MNSTDKYPYSVPEEDKFRYTDSKPNPALLATRTGKVEYNSTQQEIHKALYDGAIHYLDGHVGQVVDEIKKNGQFDNTMLIVTSDHGELLGEHGQVGHGSLYEPGVRIPLIVHPPSDMDLGLAPDTGRVNLLGLYQTLLQMVDISVPDGTRGVNVFHAEHQPVLIQDYSQTWDWSRYNNSTVGANAIYNEENKLIQHGEQTELYDLNKDPNEQYDRSSDSPKLKNKLTSLLANRIDELDDSQLNQMSKQTDFNPEIQNRLQDLGYLE